MTNRTSSLLPWQSAAGPAALRQDDPPPARPTVSPRSTSMPEGPTGLKPRGETSAAASASVAPRQTTPARQGMEQMTAVTAQVADAHLRAGRTLDGSDVSHIAYQVYQRHALHAELASMTELASKPLDGSSLADLRARDAENLQAATRLYPVAWEKKGRHPDRGSYVFKKPDEADGQVTPAQLSHRLTLTSDALFPSQDIPGGSIPDSQGSPVALDAHRIEGIAQAHRAVVTAATRWSHTEPAAFAGKAFVAAHTVQGGHADHGVLYGRGSLSPEQTRASAMRHGADLPQPSAYRPLVMEPVIPGVAYGEMHHPRVDADGTEHPQPGYPQPWWSTSFGRSRARVAAQAVQLARQGPDDRPLADRALGQLDASLTTFGYDRHNPARIAPEHLPAAQDAPPREAPPSGPSPPTGLSDTPP